MNELVYIIIIFSYFAAIFAIGIVIFVLQIMKKISFYKFSKIIGYAPTITIPFVAVSNLVACFSNISSWIAEFYVISITIFSAVELIIEIIVKKIQKKYTSIINANEFREEKVSSLFSIEKSKYALLADKNFSSERFSITRGEFANYYISFDKKDRYVLEANDINVDKDGNYETTLDKKKELYYYHALNRLEKLKNIDDVKDSKILIPQDEKLYNYYEFFPKDICGKNEKKNDNGCHNRGGMRIIYSPLQKFLLIVAGLSLVFVLIIIVAGIIYII